MPQEQGRRTGDPRGTRPMGRGHLGHGPGGGWPDEPTPPEGIPTSPEPDAGADGMIGQRAPVAQRIEQVPSKHLVAGSIPAGRARSFGSARAATTDLRSQPSRTP